jgi:hypothetical protein
MLFLLEVLLLLVLRESCGCARGAGAAARGGICVCRDTQQECELLQEILEVKLRSVIRQRVCVCRMDE